MTDIVRICPGSRRRLATRESDSADLRQIVFAGAARAVHSVCGGSIFGER